MNPADVLKYGHFTVLKTLEGVPTSEWLTGGVCGYWSVKDIVAHLASYEHWLEEVLAPFAGQKIDMPCMTQMGQLGIEGFNNAQVEARKTHTADAVLAEYNAIYSHLAEKVIPAVPAEVWSKVGTIPWYGAEYALDDFIVYGFYGHKREHSAQIDVFKDRLKSK